MAECNAQELLDDASCFACLGGSEKTSAIFALLCRINQALDPMAECNVQDLVTEGSCFYCLDSNTKATIALQLLCEINDAISGGGGGGIPLSLPACGVVDPEGVVDGNCGRTYVNTLTDTVFHKTTAAGDLTGWI